MVVPFWDQITSLICEYRSCASAGGAKNDLLPLVSTSSSALT